MGQRRRLGVVLPPLTEHNQTKHRKGQIMAARTATLTATERALLDATDSAMRIAEAHCNTLRRIKDMGVELGLLDRDLRAADAELKEARETFYATCRVYRQPFAVTAND